MKETLSRVNITTDYFTKKLHAVAEYSGSLMKIGIIVKVSRLWVIVIFQVTLVREGAITNGHIYMCIHSCWRKCVFIYMYNASLIKAMWICNVKNLIC